MGLFDTAVQKGGPITVQELAEARKLDPVLVRKSPYQVKLNLYGTVPMNKCRTYHAPPGQPLTLR